MFVLTNVYNARFKAPVVCLAPNSQDSIAVATGLTKKIPNSQEKGSVFVFNGKDNSWGYLPKSNDLNRVCAFSPAGYELFVMGVNGAWKIWNVNSKQVEVEAVKPQSFSEVAPLSLSFCPIQKQLIIGGSGEGLLISNPDFFNKRGVSSAFPHKRYFSVINACQALPANELTVALGCDNGIWLWTTAGYTKIFNTHSPIHALNLNSNGQLLIGTKGGITKGGKLAVATFLNGQIVGETQQLHQFPSGYEINCVASFGSIIAVAGTVKNFFDADSGFLCILNESGEILHKELVKYPVLCCTFSSLGSLAIGGKEDGTGGWFKVYTCKQYTCEQYTWSSNDDYDVLSHIDPVAAAAAPSAPPFPTAAAAAPSAPPFPTAAAAAPSAPPLRRTHDMSCIVCLDEDKNILLHPCGHVCLCESCSNKDTFGVGLPCPVCRTPIQTKHKVFY